MVLRYILFVLLSLMLACNNCQPEGGIQKACFPDLPCIIENGLVVTKDVIKMEFQGVCQHGITECTNGEECIGFVGKSEEVCDELDNDCDGSTDEGFDQDLDGYVECLECDDNNEYINPSATEGCNNIDDDCDGVVDGMVEKCWTSRSDAVFGGDSICVRGDRLCNRGNWSRCENETKPTLERCNGVDDDCDGETDEPVMNACGPVSTTGACERGDQFCDGEGETFCVAATYPAIEICNGIDDDCDGTKDEELERICETDCGIGREYCIDGEWAGCDAPIQSEEICDGFDNNCNGLTDEGCPCNHGDFAECVEPPLTCGIGGKICINGEWGECTLLGTQDEICNNWDDNCDGVIDGHTEPCGNIFTAGIGECKLGTKLCVAGIFEECLNEKGPRDEICNGLDDDCDRDIDEDLDPHDKVDMLFIIDDSGSMCPFTTALIAGISNYVADFTGTEHKFGLLRLPGPSPVDPAAPYVLATMPALMDIVGFQNALNNLGCRGAGFEPSYVAMEDATSPADPIRIGWRSDAYPYVVLITDEQAQNMPPHPLVTEADIAAQTINCQIGSCVSGDRIETFVITKTTYFGQWDDVVFGEAERLVEIEPPNGNRYTDILRNIFTNVCI